MKNFFKNMGGWQLCFAGNIANQFRGNGNKFDPEVNSLLVEANNFASGLDFVVGWLMMHGWTTSKLRFPLQNPVHPEFFASRDDFIEVTFSDVTFLYMIGVDPQDVSLFFLSNRLVRAYSLRVKTLTDWLSRGGSASAFPLTIVTTGGGDSRGSWV